MLSQRTPRLLECLVFAITLMMMNMSVLAGMIGTDQVIQQQRVFTDKQKIQNTLARKDVKQFLLAHGVTPQQAQQRIDQLTNQEIHQLANEFEELPAAGGAGLILLMSGPAILLLEFMGMTDLTTAF